MLWALFLTLALLDGQAERPAPKPSLKTVAVRTTQPTPKMITAAMPSPQPSPNKNEDRAAERELLELANRSREQSGLPPLRVEESLNEAALEHVRLMIEHAHLEHQFPGELPLLERIAQVSPLRMDRVGENVAQHFSAGRAHEALMLSPKHRENLLDPGFNVAGIVAVWSGDRLYVVQDFAHEVANYSAEQTAQLVSQAISERRRQAGLAGLDEVSNADLDDSVCGLAQEGRVEASALRGVEGNRGVAFYTQSQPDVLPPGTASLLEKASARQFAVGTCYARSEQYPVGMYWVAIVLY